MSYQKLVRDKIPDIIKQREDKVNKRGAFKKIIYLEGVQEKEI